MMIAGPAQIEGRLEKSGLRKKAARRGGASPRHQRRRDASFRCSSQIPIRFRGSAVAVAGQRSSRVEHKERNASASPPNPPSIFLIADKEPTMEDLPSNLGQPSTSASSVDASYSANRTEDSQLFLSVPALNQAASYLAQTASYLTQCLPVSGYTAISDEGQELATLPPASTAGGSSFQASSEQSADSSPCEIDNTGSSSQEITEQMAPLRVFQNGASLFQGLVERARKTVRGSADDIGWLQQDQSLPPTEDGTARFLEILDAVRKNEHKLPDSMVYLLVPGLFSNHGPLYFVKTKSYFSKMGLACHIAKIHSESSVSKNAREIKEYIEEIYWGSKKRVLLLGHSKGGVDAAAALSLYWPQLKDKVAGLALAQSPYGGSPVASDILREGQLGDYVRLRKLMEILVSKVLKGDLQALEDLTYERRKEFLRQNPLPPEVPIVSFHTEASITPSVLTALSHVAHLELPAAADGNPTRIPVVMPLSAAMAACSQLLVARYGEKSDGLVTRKDAEVPGSVVVRPERKLDHAWMVYSSLKEEPRDQADTSQGMVQQ
ncbi:uncharacterized protein LOC127754269 isoform X2 [Oryza glaberrima]|uniref:uncharacterized protein LOC127754269 isoform X2 n=1 Tax=Oryza glaberrima TaxID=4538 RepID=UPI00224C09F8|nr:uncharacterized protein LOC127754269 isoform X2 [Oryza glaberrima]